MKKPKLSDLTLREKIAQTICIRQYALNQKVEVDELKHRTQDEKEQIMKDGQYGCMWCQGNQVLNVVTLEEKNWGNIKVSSKEYADWLKPLCSQLKIPMLCATDAGSGGGGMYDDLTTVTRGLAIGAANSEELTYEQGACIGRELRCAGINWRWAPVEDITSVFSYGCMRSFVHNDDELLIKLSNAHIRGIQSAGVAATAKHFPSEGEFEFRDSHYTPTVNDSTMEEWWARQGKIFQGVIDGGVYSVMIGHTAFPAADDTKIGGAYIPSTLSKKIITDLLKGEMGFKGVVITDAIEMASLSALYEEKELIVQLLKAGNDVILGTYDFGFMDYVEQAVLDGRLSEERIDDACQRVLDMKEKLGMFDGEYPLCEGNPKELAPHTIEVDTKISERALTLVRDRNNQLPYDSSKIKNVTIICSAHSDGFYEALNVMKEEFEKRGARVRLHRRLDQRDEIQEIADSSDLIIYAAYLAAHTPKGAPSFYGPEMQTFYYAFTIGREKSIGVSFGYPLIHYTTMENADVFVNAYQNSPSMMRAFVRGIYGEIPLVGKSPVDLVPARRIW